MLEFREIQISDKERITAALRGFGFQRLRILLCQQYGMEKIG